MKIFILLTIIFLIGCEQNNNKKIETLPNSYAATQEDLPECFKENQGQLFYLLEEQEFVVCSNGEFLPIEINGEPGQDGKNGEDGLDGEDGENGEKTIYNASGDIIGTSSLIAYNGLYMTSNNGYFFHLNWSGEIRQDTFWFSEENCSGTIYVPQITTMPISANTLYIYDSQLYIPKNSNEIEMAIEETVNVKSIHTNGSCSNSDYTGDFIELQETTRDHVGIPENLDTPLSF